MLISVLNPGETDRQSKNFRTLRFHPIFLNENEVYNQGFDRTVVLILIFVAEPLNKPNASDSELVLFIDLEIIIYFVTVA